jgi:hypothetical protein
MDILSRPPPTRIGRCEGGDDNGSTGIEGGTDALGIGEADAGSARLHASELGLTLVSVVR